MTRSCDLILTGGTIVNQDGIGLGDVAIANGKIAAIGDVSGFTPARVQDVKGLHILPGVVDSQVHFREPGLEHKEDLESGSLSAVMGGVTAIFEMPNTKPPTTTEALLHDKLARAKGRMHCDYAFYVGATPDNADELGQLERLPGTSGVKMFMGSSTGNLLVEKDEDVARVLASGRRRIAVHSEDETRMRERQAIAAGGDVHDHPNWRDAITAVTATNRLLKLARAAGRRIHVLHVTTAEEIEILSANKDIATFEVTPQHLTIAAPDCYDAHGTLAQMNPPIRDAEHRAALWHGIQAGIVDVIGSDHAPHTREEKANAYPASPSGMPGVQTLVPLLLDHVAQGHLTLQRFVDLTSHGPNRVFGMAAKGRLAVGYDADLTLVDLAATRTIEASWLKSRCGWSPFEGQKVTGWPVGTIIRGHVVMWDGGLVTPHSGAPVRFQETLAAI
jgi:dihydroorotase